MNYKRIETFIWVATLGSFRKTAERQCTTQPAVSSRIATLEEELGVKLFEREAGGAIKLTARGQELLPYAEKVVYMAEQLKQAASKDSLFSGILRLGISETIVHTWLPRFLKRLHAEMPNLDVELTVELTTHLRNELIDRSLDIAFLMGPVSDPSIENIDLCSFPLTWAASANLQIPKRKLSANDLAKWPIITYSRQTRPFVEISKKFREQESLPTRFFTSSSLAACLRLTVDDVGISSLPKAMITDELAEGKLVEVPTSWQPSPLAFTASYPGTPYNPFLRRVAELAVDVATGYAAGE